METSTHILFGGGIASLASLDLNLQEFSLPVYWLQYKRVKRELVNEVSK